MLLHAPPLAWTPLAAAWRAGRSQQLRWCAAAAQRTAAVAPVQPSEPTAQQQHAASSVRSGKQTLDYTALCACVKELQAQWVPSKVEEVVQPDSYTLSLRLRTPTRQGWLHLSWHPTAARLAVGAPPRRGATSEAFSFSEAASQQLRGLVLVSASVPQPWERVAQLSFGVRPGEAPQRYAYCEVMAKYSNVILADGGGAVLVAAYQVGGRMSSLRQVQQGRQYALPPVTSGVPPSKGETLQSWHANVQRAAELAAAEPQGGGGGDGSSSSGGSGNGSGSRAVGDNQGEATAATATAAASGGARGRRRGGSGAAPSVLGGCVRAYQGVSPALVEELCAAAGVAPGTHPGEIEEEQWGKLHAAWRGWLERVESGSFAATVDEAGGRFSVLGSFSRPYDSVHDMLEGYYSSLQAGELHAALHQRLTAAARGALKKARGRVAAFKQQLESAASAAAVQRQADIIMANVYRIDEGAAVLEAEDWDTGEAVSIALDTTKTVVEQAEALYKRARKLRRAVDAVAPLLAAAEADVEYLEQVESEVAQLARYADPEDLIALREVQDELVEAGVMKPPPEAALAAKAAAKGRKATKKAQKGSGGGGGGAQSQGFRRFASPGGYVILVGRNNKQNDVLSHQVANPQDLWMHVRGLPGSHVLLRVEPGRGAPGDEDVECAAALAAWFSKGRASGKADVIVTRAEHVRKLKGGKPGQVLLAKEDRVVVVRPQDSLAAASDG